MILCEHPTVITLGRSADKNNILVDIDYLFENGIKIINADRGGDVTIHIPGQLVAYFIFDIKLLGRDIHRFLRKLEDVILLFLAKYDIPGERKKNLTGVWIDDKKIGAIGIGIRKWISFHGLSVNINPDMNLFSLIRPCGIKDKGVVSLAQVINQEPSRMQINDNFIEALKSVFKISNITICDSSDLKPGDAIN